MIKNHCCRFIFSFILILLTTRLVFPQSTGSGPDTNQYNISWNTQSKDATGSMPLGGGNLGLNVWVENNDLLIYLGHPDSRIENQKLIKLGRVRINFSPSPFGKNFNQSLDLASNAIYLKGEFPDGKPFKTKIWVDVYNPVVHVEVNSEKKVRIDISYESWFFEAQWIKNGLEWIYRLDPAKSSLIQKIKNQKLEAIADQIPDPLKDLTMGGRIVADGLKFKSEGSGSYMSTPYKRWTSTTGKSVKQLDVRIFAYVKNEESVHSWKKNLDHIESQTRNTEGVDSIRTSEWWKAFWNRSYININPGSAESDTAWQIGRNYQLFRYLLGCNSTGRNPTLFNGGIFTFDNPLEDFTAFGAAAPGPDERSWWDCLFMAQNQRLVYWPMIKSGDDDLLKIGLDFYRDRTELANARSKHFFDVEGTPFPESIDIYGLMAACPSDSGHHGCEHLTYHYTSSLEFAFMMLEYFRFSGKALKESMPTIMGVLKFYDNFYQKSCLELTGKPLDENGKLVIYPGNACEYGIGTRNHADAIAGLMALTNTMLNLETGLIEPPDLEWLRSFQKRIPDIPLTLKEGNACVAVAESYDKIGNPNEFTQLYTLFPFHIYGTGLPDKEIALNTWNYGADNEAIQKEFMCWKYSNIAVARLGLAEEAKKYAVNKFLYPPVVPFMSVGYGDCGRFKARFPAFWVTYPFDHFPDMDHGGCSMIGLQEMLMQTPGDRIILFPAWPKDWDVDFKLHAPGQTVVEVSYRSGKIQSLHVSPVERRADIIIDPDFEAN